MYPVLQTKLFAPHIPDGFICRETVHHRFAQVARHPLTLVSAPAGFGKSTIVAAWLNENGVRYGWLSLDDLNNDLAAFFAYFITALQ